MVHPAEAYLGPYRALVPDHGRGVEYGVLFSVRAEIEKRNPYSSSSSAVFGRSEAVFSAFFKNRPVFRRSLGVLRDPLGVLRRPRGGLRRPLGVLRRPL